MVGADAYIAVYIVTDRPRGTLYIGVTSQLLTRILQHREGLVEGFTKRYGLKRLVWLEPHEEMTTAIGREKSLKRRPRDWKINLIERDNLHWDDLFPGLVDWTPPGGLLSGSVGPPVP